MIVLLVDSLSFRVLRLRILLFKAKQQATLMIAVD